MGGEFQLHNQAERIFAVRLYHFTLQKPFFSVIKREILITRPDKKYKNVNFRIFLMLKIFLEVAWILAKRMKMSTPIIFNQIALFLVTKIL